MSEWWAVSTPVMTFAVKIDGGIIVEGAPIARRFVGQDSKRLGSWARKKWGADQVYFWPLGNGRDLYRYMWGNNAKRILLKGRMCRIIARGRMRSVLVEFVGGPGHGQREIVSIRALRKESKR